MFDTDHYVPVLKGKKGEFDALRAVPTAARDLTTPLVEVTTVPWNYVEDMPARTIGQHLDSSAKGLCEAWSSGHRVFVDALTEGDGGTEPVTTLFQLLRGCGVVGVPVVRLTDDPNYWAAVTDILAEDGRGVCLRIFDDDFARPTLGVEIDGTLAALGLGPDEVDLVADFGDLVGSPVRALQRTAEADIATLPHLAGWRSLTSVFAAFPANLTGVAPGVSTISRDDVLAYRALVAGGRLARTPTFGDYGPDNPEYFDQDPRIIRPAASIRYTDADAWLIVRGRALRGPTAPGFAQYHDLAATLVARPEFRGRAFSSGDERIDDCAHHVGGTGSLTTWRFVAVNHHLATVVDSIATLGGP
jgi:hypothetical protein